MATNKIYACPGAVTMFAASGVTGQNMLWTPQNEATARGRISSGGIAALGKTIAVRMADANKMGVHSRPPAMPCALYLVQADAVADIAQTDGGSSVRRRWNSSNEIHLYQSVTFLGTVISNGNVHKESTCGLCAKSLPVGAGSPCGMPPRANGADGRGGRPNFHVDGIAG